MLWQRYFASLPAERGNLRLIAGTAIAPFIYFALYLVPIALTAFLIPLVFVPLCGLCIALSVREMRVDQPMFEDVPRQHPRVYRQAISDYWRSALCVGSLALASGVIRGIALLHEEIAAVVNSASMLGSFVSAAVLLVLWYRMSFRFGLTSVFRVVYPVIITGFLLLPLFGSDIPEPVRGLYVYGVLACSDAYDDAVRAGFARPRYQPRVHLRVLWRCCLHYAKRGILARLGERFRVRGRARVAVHRGDGVKLRAGSYPACGNGHAVQVDCF